MTTYSPAVSPAPGLTASLVRMTPYTIHGWRPTSVVVQPASMAIAAPTPARLAARRNHGERGRSRRRHQASSAQAPSSTSAVPMPTIRSKA